jgi:serine/threonine protein kinase
LDKDQRRKRFRPGGSEEELNDMDAAHQRQIDKLYHLALEKPAHERASFLDESCGADPSLRREIESMLAITGDAGVPGGGTRAKDVQAKRTTPALSDLTIQKLGRYTLLEVLGQGGMGVVYRAVDPAIGRTVAIKTILFQGNVGEQEASALRSRLLRESQAGGQLSHPNIVAVYDVCEQDDMSYIVMEFVDGQTLERAIGNDTSLRPGGEALRVIRETASALDYAHSRGIVHRDIKPANIMLQTDGAVKIADFGIAKAAQFSPLTQSATILGSPYYMAPEQWKGEPVTGRADQYALAVVAYALFTGNRPFEGDTMATLAAKALYEEPPPATKSNPALPPAIDDVFRQALSKNAAARYESCGQFADALRSAYEKRLPVETVPAASPSATPPPDRLRRSFRVAAIFLLVGLTTAVGLWLYQRSKAAEQETAYWTSIRGSKTSAPFAAYLNRYPEGRFAGLAQAQLEALKQNQQPPEPVPKVPAKETKATAKVNPTKTGDKSPRNSGQGQVSPVPEPQQSLTDVLYAQGNVVMKSRDFVGALPYFNRAIILQPEYRSYFARAGANQHLDRLEQAIEDYSQAIHFDPTSAMAYHERAVCEARLKKDDHALADYQRALELAPGYALSWDGRGAIYLHRKEYKKAENDFTEAIRLAPTLGQAYKNRAAARKALGNLTGASADLMQAHALKE